MTPIRHPSPNFGPRRDGLTPTLVVLHYTAMQSAEAALARLSDPQAEVSAHYLIGRDGTIWHMVEEANRAWHAGAGEWRGQSDINSRSIGIELDNRGDHPFSEPLMTALEALLADIMQRRNILPANVIGHSDMAPGRKRDPGQRFDWARLALRHLVTDADFMPTPELDARPALPEQIADALRAVGYTADVPLAAMVSAFRARFRPGRIGPPSQGDLALARMAASKAGIDPDATAV